MAESNEFANVEWTFDRLRSAVRFRQTPTIFLEKGEGEGFRFVKREMGGGNIPDIYGHRFMDERVNPEDVIKCSQGEGEVLFHGRELKILVPPRLTRVGSRNDPRGSQRVIVEGGSFTVIRDPSSKYIAFLDPQ